MHDLKATRAWGILHTLAQARVPVPAHKGCIGAGHPVLTPARGTASPRYRKRPTERTDGRSGAKESRGRHSSQRPARSSRRHDAHWRATVVVRLLLPPCLCVLPGQMHNRRSAAKPDRIRWASMPLACGFTLGPHHPSEGSQQRSCPLHPQDGQVLITPQRDRNAWTVGTLLRPAWSPHHPSEGSQLPPHHHVDVPLAVLITPQRDRNPPRSGRGTVRAGPHHPSERSQLDSFRGGVRASETSSSPLRGIATSRTSIRSFRLLLSSSPLRGIATRSGTATTGRLRRVLITPQRDRNWTLRTSVAWGPRRVLIASEEANHQQRPRRRNFEYRLSWPVPASSHSMTSTGQPRPPLAVLEDDAALGDLLPVCHGADRPNRRGLRNVCQRVGPGRRPPFLERTKTPLPDLQSKNRCTCRVGGGLKACGAFLTGIRR